MLVAIFVVLGQSLLVRTASEVPDVSDSSRGSSVLDTSTVSKELAGLSSKSGNSHVVSGPGFFTLPRPGQPLQGSRHSKPAPDIVFTVEDAKVSDGYSKRDGFIGTGDGDNGSIKSSESCPYWLTLPSTDAICVAATDLSNSMNFDIVKFHLLRYSEGSKGKRVAIVGCSDVKRKRTDTATSGEAECIVEELSPSKNIQAIGSTSSEVSHAVELSSFFANRECYIPQGAQFHSCPGSDGSTQRCLFATASESFPVSFDVPPACYRVKCLAEPVTVLSLPPQPVFDVAKDVTFVDFAKAKFINFSYPEKSMFIIILLVMSFLLIKGYTTIRQRYSMTDPANAVTQPYEVALKSGEGDSVEFEIWQSAEDVANFQKKLADMRHRLTKLPFAHAASTSDLGGSDSEEGSGRTVMFLGRNVDDPKLVFRNPRTEKEQRANIPRFTQALRNAVAASMIKESSQMKAYVPRALVGSWNKVEGVFQEYVNGAKPVTLQDLKDSPATTTDMALFVMLLRDTDAHDGNYARDTRRKVALYDLGCALADRPLPAYERDCLDNFEVLQRLPDMLDVPFEERHVSYLKAIDFSAAKEMWSKYEYSTWVTAKLESLKQSRRRDRAYSSLLPSSSVGSPRSLPALLGGLLSPRSRASVPPELPSGSGSSASTEPGLHALGLASPKSVRSLPAGDLFSLNGWEDSDTPRVVKPLDMIKVMEVHANFLLRCAEKGKTMLFAARILYSGLYDEKWIDVGGRVEDLPALELELFRLADESEQRPPVLVLGMRTEGSDVDGLDYMDEDEPGRVKRNSQMQ